MIFRLSYMVFAALLLVGTLYLHMYIPAVLVVFSVAYVIGVENDRC